MATKLARSPHRPGCLRPVRCRPVGGGRRARRTAFCQAATQPLLGLQAREDASGRRIGWGRRALREAVVAAVFTTMLTSAVLAAPEMFRQSPAVSWRAFTTPRLAAGPLPGGDVLLDCP
jgi:hypothetical protein